MNSGPKRRGIQIAILLLTAIAMASLAWLVTHKPITLLQIDSWVCANCAEQKSVSSRKILEIRGPIRTKFLSTPIHQILSPGSDSPCPHSWVHVHEWKDFFYVYPKVQGHTAIHLIVNLDGIERDAGFAAALASIAQINRPLAQKCWSTLLAAFSRPPTERIQQLRDMLSAKAPPAEIAEHLKQLTVTAGPSAP
jgi:hypothetical protein